jgi:hypothetical protein
LAGDRWLTLFGRAVASGLIDPEKADYSSLAWLRRVRCVIDYLESEEYKKILQDDLFYHAICIGSSDVNFGNEHFKLAADARELLYKIRFSWQERHSPAATIKTMNQVWEAAHGGSMEDPKVAALVNQTAAAMYRRAEEGRKEAAKTYRPKAKPSRRR